MNKIKRNAKIGICIAIVLMLLSGIVASAIQTNGYTVKMKELAFETDEGWTMAAYLMVPENASAETPAPAVIVSHGYENNKEIHDAFWVELARRGFVVLAIDQPSHGDSENTEAVYLDGVYYRVMQARGVYQAALMLSRLEYVDPAKIGATGHSMGGLSITYAIEQENENGTHLISSVLFNSQNPNYVDGNGNFVNYYGDRDLGIIAGVHDDFFFTSMSENGEYLYSPYFMESATAQSVLHFGKDPSGLEVREADTYYYETLEDGQEHLRVIYRPDIIHAGAHFSKTATAMMMEYFDTSLGAPIKLDSSDQIWQWKEAFNFVGVIGFVLFIINLAIILARTEYFSEICASNEVVAPRTVNGKAGKIWFWGGLSVCMIIATISYIPLLRWGTRINLVSQVETIGKGVWSTFCGLILILFMFCYYYFYGKKNGFNSDEVGIKLSVKKALKTVLLAVIVAISAYGCVFVVHYLFTTDFRLWTLCIKAFNRDKIPYILEYVWLFLIFYISSSVATNCFNYNTIGGKYGNAIINGLFTAAPAIILVAYTYIYYEINDTMSPIIASNGNTTIPISSITVTGLHIIWLIPLVLILFAAPLISRAIYRKTKNPYIAGIITAIVVCIMGVTNTHIPL